MEIRPSGLIVAGVGERKSPVFFCAACAPERRERGEGPLGFAKDQAEAYQRHVVACAASREEELRARSARVRLPGIYGDAGWDTEFEQWVRDNRKSLISGGKRM